MIVIEERLRVQLHLNHGINQDTRPLWEAILHYPFLCHINLPLLLCLARAKTGRTQPSAPSSLSYSAKNWEKREGITVSVEEEKWALQQQIFRGPAAAHHNQVGSHEVESKAFH